MVGEPTILALGREAEATTRRGRKPKGGTFGVAEVSIGISVLTQIPVAMGREWWLKTPSECEGLASPIAEALNKLPKAQAERLQSLILPVSIITAALGLFADSIQMERQLSQQRKQENETSGTIPLGPNQAPERGTGTAGMDGISERDIRARFNGHAPANDTPIKIPT